MAGIVFVALVIFFVLDLLPATNYPLTPVLAFQGPSSTAGVGSGAIGVDSANNLSVGTSTTKAETKFLIVASSTADTANFALKVIDKGQGPLFLVRNDGSISIATSGMSYTLNVGGNVYASGNVTCGGSCGGTVLAQNVSAGVFGGAGSGALYAFPSNLGVATSSQVGLPAPLSVYTVGSATTSAYFSGSVGIGTPGGEAVRFNLDVLGNYLQTQKFFNVSAWDGVSAPTTRANLWTLGREGGRGGGSIWAEDTPIIITKIAAIGGGGGIAIGPNVTWPDIPSSTSPTPGINIKGNVGINTAYPSSTFHVVGTSTFSASVGIGTAGPQAGYKLNINGPPSRLVHFGFDFSTEAYITSLENSPRLEGTWLIGSSGAGNDDIKFGRLGVGVNGGAGAYFGPYGTNSDLVFQTGGGGGQTTTYPMIIKSANSGNQVGIGTSNPTSTLTVAGEIKSTSGGIRFPDNTLQTTAAAGGASQWTTSGSNIYYNTGNVGIGTSTPSDTLVVTKSSASAGITIAANGISKNGILTLIGTGGAGESYTNTIQGQGNTIFTYNSAGIGGHLFYGAGTAIAGFDFPSGTTGRLRLFSGGAVNSVINTSGDSYLMGGNVGIGTTAPNKPLDVAISGGIRISQTGSASSSNELYFQDNGQIRSADDNHRIIFDRANNIIELREYGDLVFSPGATSSVRTQTVTFKSGGNVGIGTATPDNTIQVANLIDFDNARFVTKLGYQAGNSNTGSGNSFVGYNAGFTNTTGANNTANGYLALRNNTTGNTNSAFGVSALAANSTGISNTAIGTGNLETNLTASYNTAVGAFTLDVHSTGNNNVALGYYTLGLNQFGNSNTAIGTNAGYNNIGSGNVFLGYQAGYNETSSNKLYIANNSTTAPLIYGDFASNFVAIGTSRPVTALDVVNGDIRHGNTFVHSLTRALPITVGNYIEIGNFVFTNGGGSLWVSITVPSGGYSVAKEYLIPIQYNQTVNVWQTAIPISNTGPYAGSDFALDINVNNATAYLRLRDAAATVAGTAYVTLRHEGVNTDVFTATSLTGTNTPTVFFGSTALTQVGGKVGIGTTGPTSALTISDAANTLAGQQIYLGNPTYYYTFGRNQNTGLLDFYGNQGGTATGYTFSNGNVGIGTTNPTSKLQVVGLPVYANNAAAITGGLTVGAFYRNGADPDMVAVVH